MNRTFLMSLAATTLFGLSLAAQESRSVLRSFDLSYENLFEQALKEHALSWQLVSAIRKHDLEGMKTLLKNPNINVNPVTLQGTSLQAYVHPLNEAISCNNIEAVKLLLAHTVTLGTTKINADGSMAGHYFDVKDININAPGYNGLTPLHVAVSFGRIECLKLLLPQTQSARSEVFIPTFVTEPASNINAADKDGNTALHLAVSLDKADFVEVLLAQPGINVNAENNEGWTPLHTAVWYETTDCIKLLLEHKDIAVDQSLIDLVEKEFNKRNEKAKRAREILQVLSRHILDGPGGMSPNYDWRGILIGPDTLPNCPCCPIMIA